MRYIGSKINLLTDINNIIAQNINDNSRVFLDLFGGTNSVGNFFKDKYTIYSNDILYFSFVNAKAIIENNGGLEFKNLKSVNINSPIDYLQSLSETYIKSEIIGYYEKNYTPTGGAMYLSVENGKRIDCIRDTIDLWYKHNLLTKIEYFYLISVLIEAIPFVSNTTGTYGAFLKHWDKRALHKLKLKPLRVKNNQNMNRAFNQDANQLVKNIKIDIAYIDTPYNSRQYASNYHLLENVARNEKPELKGKTKIFEWSGLKSDYATKTKALKAMSNLVENIDSTHIILSYNSEGIIPENDLIELLKIHAFDGNVKITRIPYRKYQSKIGSKTLDLHELLIYVQKKKISNVVCNVKKKTETLKVWQCPSKDYIKSPLNYIGGKHKLLKQIMPLFPKNINTFVDLFSGGCNIGINASAQKYIFNDMNKLINEMFRYFVSCNTEYLIQEIKDKIKKYGLSKTNQEAYLDFRKKYNNNPNPLDLYVLVSYSYNYQFRFNNSLKFNNPFGKNRSQFSTNMENNLRLFVNRLQLMDAVFTDQYFNDVDLSGLNPNDFVYIDPPYLITTGSYNDGNRGFLNWTENQEKKLYEIMDCLNNQGVRFALSNVLRHKGKKNTLLEQYIDRSNLHTHYLNFHYNNSSYNSKGVDSCEVLITNYNPKTFNILSVN